MAKSDQKNESVNEEQRRSNDLALQADKDATTETPAREEVNATELSKSELVNDAVDQETGEVKLGQPGGTDGQSASDRPTMTEEQAREVNGYAGFENIAEQRKADPTKAENRENLSDTLYKKS